MPHLLGFFRPTMLTFIDKRLDHGDVYVFRFKPSRPLKHSAGQHALFIAKHGRPHIFSLANAPEEDAVMIATHVRAKSPFKQALAELNSGDRILMVGPVLDFTLEGAPETVVFLAQGVGITPFRSMLVHNARQADHHLITLIHSDGFEPTFGDETKALAVTSHYPDNTEAFTTLLGRTVAAERNAWFYIAGNPEFVKETKSFLTVNRVPKARIKTDSYLGY